MCGDAETVGIFCGVGRKNCAISRLEFVHATRGSSSRHSSNVLGQFQLTRLQASWKRQMWADVLLSESAARIVKTPKHEGFAYFVERENQGPAFLQALFTSRSSKPKQGRLLHAQT
jgi:hypothetical protein